MKIILIIVLTELILIYQHFIFCKNRFNYVIINTVDSSDSILHNTRSDTFNITLIKFFGKNY